MTELEVRIEKIVAGGDGLARHEGRVVFVPGSAPGERHRVRVLREKADYVRAVSVEVLESSPDRRTPPCPYYESCGGCRLMHLRPEAQLEAKRLILLEGIERATREPYDEPLPLHSAKDTFYRNRLRFHVAFVGNAPIAGFRRRESREIVDIDRCLLGTETLNRVWERIRPRSRRGSPPRPSGRRGGARGIDRTSQGGSPPGFLVSSIDGLRAFEEGRRESLVAELGLVGMVAAVDEDRGGGPGAARDCPYVEHRVSGFTLRQSVGSFFQSNRFLLRGSRLDRRRRLPRGGSRRPRSRSVLRRRSFRPSPFEAAAERPRCREPRPRPRRRAEQRRARGLRRKPESAVSARRRFGLRRAGEARRDRRGHPGPPARRAFAGTHRGARKEPVALVSLRFLRPAGALPRRRPLSASTVSFFQRPRALRSLPEHAPLRDCRALLRRALNVRPTCQPPDRGPY